MQKWISLEFETKEFLSIYFFIAISQIFPHKSLRKLNWKQIERIRCETWIFCWHFDENIVWLLKSDKLTEEAPEIPNNFFSFEIKFTDFNRTTYFVVLFRPFRVVKWFFNSFVYGQINWSSWRLNEDVNLIHF